MAMLLASGALTKKAGAQLGFMGMVGPRRSSFSGCAGLACDDFDRGTGLGANWTQEGTSTISITGSTQLTTSASSPGLIRYNAVTPNADQYMRVTVVTATYGGPACRCQAGADTEYNCASDGGNAFINRVVAGVNTQIGATITFSRTTPHLLELRVSGVGATVTVEMWATPSGDVNPANLVLIDSRSDNSGGRIVTAGYLGISMYGTTSRVDNAIGGNL